MIVAVGDRASAARGRNSGTAAKRGKAHAVVVATAGHTKFGRTVELVESAGAEFHFCKAVPRIGHTDREEPDPID